MNDNDNRSEIDYSPVVPAIKQHIIRKTRPLTK
jgi:hypothetical protein